MIKEYINRLITDNDTELISLEDRMQSLIDELTYTEKWHENLEIENNSHKNIFSPRTINRGSSENLETVRNRIIHLNHEIEYTRALIETHLKNKSEYQLLSDEIGNNEITNNEIGKSITESQSIIAHTKNEKIDDIQLNNLINEIYKKIEIADSLLNINKHKCKLELTEIRRLIDTYWNKIN